MIRRVAALSVVGGLVVGSLALGVAAPAHAAPLIDYRQYQQTLPASVIDGSPLTDEEKIAWTNGTRSGVTSVPVAPVGPVPTKSQGTLPGILGMLGMLVSVGGQMEASYSFSDDLWWKHSEKPDWIPQDEWDACSSGGDASNIFDGFADWTASIHNIMGTGTGEPMNCADVREDWLLPKNDEWEDDTESDGGLGSWPATISGTSITGLVLEPFWSTNLTTFQGVTRQEGWIYRITVTSGSITGLTALNITYGTRTPTGLTEGTLILDSSTSGAPRYAVGGLYRPSDTRCGAATYCIPLWRFVTSSATLAPSPQELVKIRPRGADGLYSGGATTDLPPMPYVPVTSGNGYQPGEQPHVMMTTVWTEAGNRYSCTTTAFAPSAPTIPRPCEPDVPDWEIITERTVEMVPETDAPSYVPGSNPSRGIQTTTVPDVVRDWQREHPGCDETLCLLDLELEGVGSCFDNPEECANWYTDPNKTTRYTCTYGGTVVDLSQCVKYARLFKPDAITQGSAYPQPGTSNPSGTPTSPQTSSPPNTATQPGTGVLDPSKPRDCWPTGWGVFNPVEWVYKPVRCVLEWAFVPRDAYVQSVIRSMQLKWTSSSLVGLLAVLEEASDLVLSPGGCEGPSVNIDIYGTSYSGNPLSACHEPMASAAQFSFIFTGIAAWVMAVASIARSIAGVVAFKGIGGDSA